MHGKTPEGSNANNLGRQPRVIRSVSLPGRQPGANGIRPLRGRKKSVRGFHTPRKLSFNTRLLTYLDGFAEVASTSFAPTFAVTSATSTRSCTGLDFSMRTSTTGFSTPSARLLSALSS